MEFIKDYFSDYQRLAFNYDLYPDLIKFKELAIETKESGKKMMFAGNGASAAIAAHGAVDFTKQAGVRAITFNEADLITCYANDYGYDNWLAQALDSYADAGDTVVLISVSGTSPSVVNAAKYARENNIKVVTFTGRSIDNDLKKLGDINFWVDSHAYNIVECIHMIWVTTAIDLVIGKKEYET